MICKSWDIVFTILVISLIAGYFGDLYLNGFDPVQQLVVSIQSVLMTAGVCYFILVALAKVFGEGDHDGEFDEELDIW